MLTSTLDRDLDRIDRDIELLLKQHPELHTAPIRAILEVLNKSGETKMEPLLDFIRTHEMCRARNDFELKLDGKVHTYTLPKLRKAFQIFESFTHADILAGIQSVKREVRS